MRLVEIKARISAGAANEVDDRLLEWGDRRWSLLEDVVGRRAWIVGIFADRAEALASWAALRPHLEIRPLGTPVVRRLAHRNWRESYRAHFKAWSCGRLHWVPSWERARFRRPPGHAVLWLDPGMAFGTGNHETTRLCCRRLVELARSAPKASVIDAGCGSGILALSAARLGLGAISGFDIDPEAIRVSRQNAVRNRLSGRVKFRVADLARGLERARADVVLANIQADILMRNVKRLRGAVAPGGALVLSGILASEMDGVRAAFGTRDRAEVRTLGQWSSLTLFPRT